MLTRFLLALALVAFGGSALAQSPPRQEFGSLKTFRCDFTESEGRRTSATGVTENATRETFKDLVIDSVDYAKRTARFIGNAGSETVALFDGPRTVTFVEEAPVGGNLNMLSIFKRTGSLANYRAVYSRHTALSTGDLVESQSYGTCRGLL